MTYVPIWRHPHDKTRIVGYKYVEMTSNLRLGPPLVPLVLLLLATLGHSADTLPIKGRLPLPSGDRTHGLTELANRTGWRELRHFQRGESYLSERTVFRDSKTGVLAWKMTADPAVDANDYYDLPTWNADGSAMAFLSSRSGRKEFWLMNADGSKPRPLRVRDQNSAGEPVLAGYWGVRHRDRFYQAVRDGNGVAITTINPFTGERRTLVKVNRDLGDMMPPHPSEEWFLFGQNKKGTGNDPNSSSKAFVVGLDGSVQELTFERNYHRLRFTKSPDRRVYFNFDDPRTQWSILPDGSARTSLPAAGFHPDWMPGGTELFYFDGMFAALGGKVWGVRHDGSGLRVIGDYGGHGGPSMAGDWFVADDLAITVFRTDGSKTAHTLFQHDSSIYPHSVLWHPDHHTSHPHPSLSPDGTKAVFNSDFLGQYTDLYVSVARYPDPPLALQLRGSGAQAEVAWSAPRRSIETRGYYVYRSDESGVRYRRMTQQPVSAKSWRAKAGLAPGFYVVTAVEHSGLESRASNEVFVGDSPWKGFARIAVEAEAGTARLPMEEQIDQRGASNGLYAVSREDKAGGSLAVDIDVPKAGSYRLWARIKGRGRIQAKESAGEWGAIDCAAKEWSWRAAAKPLQLAKGAHLVTVEPQTGGEAVDKFLLTDDPKFVPAGTMEVDTDVPLAPTKVEVAALAPNTLKLRWTASAAGDLDHYNVYSGADANFRCQQAALAGSPSGNEFVDWGLALNAPKWYKVTAVDRAGHESAPSAAGLGRTPRFEPVRISLKPAEARVQDASVTWEFVAPREGDYAIWGLTVHDKGKPVAFDIFLDGKPAAAWKVWGPWGKPVWSAAGSKVSGTPETFRIGAGKHSFRAVAKNPLNKTPEIVITDDMSWWPVTGMSNRRVIDAKP